MTLCSAFPVAAQKRSKITFKLKSYKDGKMINSRCTHIPNLDIENI